MINSVDNMLVLMNLLIIICISYVNENQLNVNISLYFVFYVDRKISYIYN